MSHKHNQDDDNEDHFIERKGQETSLGIMEKILDDIREIYETGSFKLASSQLEQVF
jgi:hypothetical protein